MMWNIILPLKYQVHVLQMLHDDQGHQGIERTTALCREHFCQSTMYKNVAEYVKDHPQCQVAKGPYVGPKTQPGSIMANGPLDLLFVDFTNMDPSRDSKENALVLTDAFSKFSQAFVTPNQKALTVAKIIVDKCFYIYRIAARIQSDKGRSFENSMLEHLYTMYGIKQSTTTTYNPHGNSTCERFNHMCHNLLKTLDKEQKANWPCIYHLWCLLKMLCHIMSLVTSHMSSCLAAKLQLSAMLGSGWLNIMTSIHKVRAYGLMNNMNSSLLQIGGH